MIFKRAAELERFFEKDVIDFLDKKLALRGAQSEINDLETAIKKKDYEEASRIIQEAIEKFNRTDVKDVYREVNFNKVLELIRIAHAYTDTLTERNKLIIDLELLEKSGELNKDSSKNINVFEERKIKELRKKEERLREDRDKARRIENESIEINKKLFESIRTKDVNAAILNYKKLKNKFSQYPNSLKQEKTEFFNDLIAYYMRIKKIKSELLEQQDKNNYGAANINKEDRDKARDINDQIAQINREIFVSLRKEDLKNAILNYKKLKDFFENYPDSFLLEKKDLHNDVLSFYNKIDKLKKKILKQKNKSILSQKAQEKGIKLGEIKEHVEEIKKYIEENKLTEARLRTLEFKNRINNIPENYINIKNILNNVADHLIQKMELAKRANN